jgi:hypothetical protein
MIYLSREYIANEVGVKAKNSPTILSRTAKRNSSDGIMIRNAEVPGLADSN